MIHFKHIRKISAVLLTAALFVTGSSFSPAATRQVSENRVLLIDDEGQEIEVSMSGDTVSDDASLSYSADADDVQKLVNESKKAAAAFESKSSGTAENSDATIYEGNGKYSNAAFDDDWSLILINKEHHIPDDYQFELGTIKGDIKSDVRVTEHILALIQAAKNDNVNIYICSPYRDLEKQTKLFEKKMKYYQKQGYSDDDAYELASETVAIPGTSEHQVGLAFDLISDEYKNLDAGFADTEAGRWLAKNAPDYGFILRYPKGKEKITEIEFEPWHYRYVGVKAAKDITERGMCLEEYDKMIGLVD